VNKWHCKKNGQTFALGDDETVSMKIGFLVGEEQFEAGAANCLYSSFFLSIMLVRVNLFE